MLGLNNGQDLEIVLLRGATGGLQAFQRTTTAGNVQKLVSNRIKSLVRMHMSVTFGPGIRLSAKGNQQPDAPAKGAS